ncbi:ribosomal protein S18-alanine N-acetyltransferase [Agreia sp. COWG]|uniref:ribosomal protein S18-alanine N-acetyltransferase n=1 Tax=Agreia sp. COWG TaxID=2773266 RepID=UPI001AFA0CC8|nr:ribosomal protein S18-alanine N-acetyltransferase [Agreia sp. COWG]CAD6004283.1 Ribosomal-protein-S18p-alanine acetyltransferase [Agreia sp. COWG]
MSFELRRADLGDLDSIMALEQSSFPADAWTSDAMRSDLESPHCYYLVAREVDARESHGQIVGYAGLLAPAGAHEGDIQTIAVAPDVRRRGLGRVLMTSLMNEARRRGLREVFLEVRADNPHAEALYASLGFERLGVRTGYYQPDNVDAIVMRCPIAAARTRWAAEPGLAAK